MTLNDLERRNSPYFAFFSPNSTDFEADYITVVEDRPITSVKYCLPVPSTFGENYNYICDSRASCSSCHAHAKILVHSQSSALFVEDSQSSATHSFQLRNHSEKNSAALQLNRI